MNATIISTGGRRAKSVIAFDFRRVVMCGGWGVWHVIIASPGPGTQAWHVTCDMGGLVTRDTWHHATLTIRLRSENTLNGNMLSYLNPLTPHWASAPNKTISDVSSGWSYHRLKGDNWDHNPFPALWKPQCLRAGPRLIPVLCLSELSPWSQIWHCEWRVRAEWQAVSKWPVPGYWWRCGIIMGERETPSVSWHVTLTPPAVTCGMKSI